MTTITKKLAALAIAAATLIATGNAHARGHHDPVHGPGSSHDPIVFHPVHGPGSSHNPIIVQPVQPVHGVGSSHNPIVCVRGTLPGTLDCRGVGSAR